MDAQCQVRTVDAEYVQNVGNLDLLGFLLFLGLHSNLGSSIALDGEEVVDEDQATAQSDSYDSGHGVTQSIGAQSFYEILEWERSKQQVDSYLLRTAGTRWESLQNLFRRGVEEAEEKRLGWEAAVVGNTMLLICQLMRALNDKTAVPMRREKPELLDRVMAYIEENYSKRLTVSDAAAHFYVSPSTISHLFRQKMGVSFYRCVTQRRLIAAKNLIIQGAALEQVNEQVGFSDYSTFYRAFRQEFGISPRQFRKLQETSERSL